SERIYTGALHVGRPLLPLLARGDGKLARGVRGRAGVLERMEAWAREHRDPARPLAWFHAPSVGEGLQARAVVEVFRARRPDAQVVYTFFSPSAARFAATVPADFADYLPMDFPADVDRALDLLRPSLIAFSKTDVWPNLAERAARRGVLLALLSATLPAGSSRLSGPARFFLAPAYRRLDRVAAISPADADRFAALGVPEERRSVMGDARFDQVWHGAAVADRSAPSVAPLLQPGPPVLVAGSTWPADEERLLPAVATCRDGLNPVRLVLVPHEPTEAHLRASEAALDGLGLHHVRLSAALAREVAMRDVLLVDRVGILGELYAAADVAYVGGGFGTAGIHSVLEPAAFGAPVLFGPRHANAREAAELVAAGGAFAEPDEAALAARIHLLATDRVLRGTSGASARAYVAAGLGAADRGAEIVAELLA
ncbi:MAG TPA: glycosyltransferase N-terminal domain-containing protein, partial [Longimicrobiaceae bacterium]|nr:glycosyltransferase N-terminal domain-containing protein [Longimicrobiaceae bacterium]